MIGRKYENEYTVRFYVDQKRAHSAPRHTYIAEQQERELPHFPVAQSLRNVARSEGFRDSVRTVSLHPRQHNGCFLGGEESLLEEDSRPRC